MPKLLKSPFLGVLAFTCVVGLLEAFGQPSVTYLGQAAGWAEDLDHLSAIGAVGKAQDSLKQVLTYNYTLPKAQVRMGQLGRIIWTVFQAVWYQTEPT